MSSRVDHIPLDVRKPFFRFENVVPTVAVLLAVIHMFSPMVLSKESDIRVDSSTLLLLSFSVLPWIFPFIKSLKWGDLEVQFRDLQAQVNGVERKVDVIEDQGLLPGRPDTKHKKTKHKLTAELIKTDDWNTDPNKGKFGGRSEWNGRALSAVIEPAAGPRSAACHVTLSVVSTNQERPLAGTVTFHLHPTFGKYAKYTVPVTDGMATDTITSWGVFTVGVDADDGETKLELDLASVRGGTDKFYEQ